MTTNSNKKSHIPEGRSTPDGYLLPDHWVAPQDRLWTKLHSVYVNRVVELLKNAGVHSLLEVGCGDGWNCGKAVEAGMDVVGVDFSQNGIDHCRRLVPQGRFLCSDITEETFRKTFPTPFDGVMFVEVIEHIPPEDCVQVLKNIRTFLKTGGCMVLTTPSTNKENRNPQHYRHFTVDILDGLFKEAGGLTLKHAEGYGDVIFERRYYKLAHFFDNRLFVIKPLREWYQNKYRDKAKATPLDRCHGLILVAEATE